MAGKRPLEERLAEARRRVKADIARIQERETIEQEEPQGITLDSVASEGGMDLEMLTEVLRGDVNMLTFVHVIIPLAQAHGLIPFVYSHEGKAVDTENGSFKEKDAQKYFLNVIDALSSFIGPVKLATEAGMQAPHLYAIKRQNSISIKTVEGIAEAAGFNVHYLVSPNSDIASETKTLDRNLLERIFMGQNLREAITKRNYSTDITYGMILQLQANGYLSEKGCEVAYMAALNVGAEIPGRILGRIRQTMGGISNYKEQIAKDAAGAERLAETARNNGLQETWRGNAERAAGLYAESGRYAKAASIYSQLGINDRAEAFANMAKLVGQKPFNELIPYRGAKYIKSLRSDGMKRAA